MGENQPLKCGSFPGNPSSLADASTWSAAPPLALWMLPLTWSAQASPKAVVAVAGPPLLPVHPPLVLELICKQLHPGAWEGRGLLAPGAK